ncbi:SGNH/GDSL hydrolase family protein [Streptomyces sp. XM4193]|uniref:SGNH/GDSL hydrolase family protein n=1 Tax=Streptomyces sp. XM4193 TaxID=2929782 RepID=UPI0035AC00A8
MRPSRFIKATAVFAALVTLPLASSGTALADERAAESYVAVGDSYSSGAGAGDYQDSGCKRSNNAYPVLWSNANSPSSFDFTACSGATTDDVVNNQLGPLSGSTSLVSISAGGNDAGFAGVMTTCVLQGESACISAAEEARGYINNTLPGKLDTAYNAISAKAPNAKVVVLGYSRLYELNGSCSVGISEAARAALNKVADELNEVTNKRAADHGFTFGDVRSAFTGHEICSADTWLHSVTFPLGDSYHPTAAGQSGGYLPVFRSAV